MVFYMRNKLRIKAFKSGHAKINPHDQRPVAGPVSYRKRPRSNDDYQDGVMHFSKVYDSVIVIIIIKTVPYLERLRET